MDSKTLRLTILCVLSVMALAISMVFYANKEEKTGAPANTKESNNEVKAPEDSYHAFLEDETFFDKEDGTSPIIKREGDPYLSMIATSVNHDIRVIVTDEDGNVIKGKDLYVLLDEEEYKDVDRDGVISIPDLSAGDYYVTLERVDGYEVPKDPMRVTVKDNLEFTVIGDISYLIHTEDEINAALEDTSENEGIDPDDEDNTEVRDIRKPENAEFGIDVSKWQKDIDWDRVADSGVKFAIIRIGYRGSSTGVLVEDPRFKRNIEEARRVGIKVGVYFFTQATNEVEAVEEASMVISLLEQKKLDYPVFIDTEKAAGGNGRADGLDKNARTSVVLAFCQTIKNSGYDAGVYASRNWFYNNLDDSKLKDYVIWDAEYRKEPVYTGDYKIWQYTSSGMIDGINTRVDLNISYY